MSNKYIKSPLNYTGGKYKLLPQILPLFPDNISTIYCDPPYLSSTATYNEKNGWTEKDELNLYDFLCKITVKNVRWALSNNLSTNPLLEEFANKNALKIHYLNNSYSNCNYHKKDKANKDCEVLITNY